ncbi:hypothetical protein Wildcat_136 [Mycobacterium phage Wildcat]|uniref:Exonuclease domain-containing protein n=3 Tax=Mycobacterium virus Wildcat TaxID=1993859 RepID=Q19XU8_9CAUD|nr:DNA polymerase exonuclease subunit [Mycobacterium phage Wildcat]ABE67716.1 hypothetical protein Wildcat_136 [Mycobacterium phage Wildcat]AJD82184.1 DnaQ-like protein [Mycobacterium phage Cosmo]QGJ89997.1 DNA polymerase III subunit [Mycobacterium phage MaryV]WKR36118.1 DNA polymerase exonuclease subunit [Mycobacterium phage Azrael100]
MRHIIVVDVETTGLGLNPTILEVAAKDLMTDRVLSFIPNVPSSCWAGLDPQAMAINRYFERGSWRDMLTPNETRDAYAELRDMLDGNTFAGSNPSFDSKLLARNGAVTWHHRLLDLAAYAAGVLDLNPWELPGLDDVAKALGIPIPEERHGALADVELTAQCFRTLYRERA